MGPRLVNRGNGAAFEKLAQLAAASMGPRLVNRGNSSLAILFNFQIPSPAVSSGCQHLLCRRAVGTILELQILDKRHLIPCERFRLSVHHLAARPHRVTKTGYLGISPFNT